MVSSWHHLVLQWLIWPLKYVFNYMITFHQFYSKTTKFEEIFFPTDVISVQNIIWVHKNFYWQCTLQSHIKDQHLCAMFTIGFCPRRNGEYIIWTADSWFFSRDFLPSSYFLMMGWEWKAATDILRWEKVSFVMNPLLSALSTQFIGQREENIKDKWKMLYVHLFFPLFWICLFSCKTFYRLHAYRAHRKRYLSQ